VLPHERAEAPNASRPRDGVADIPDLEACSAFGATAEEALAEVEQAKRAWLAVAREAGRAIPEPRYRPAIYAR
jgi:predicted RNase H-like HicB family nuclease